MPIDYSRVESKAKSKAQSREDRKVEFIADAGEQVDMLMTFDTPENLARLVLAKASLGVRLGKDETLPPIAEVLGLLGYTTDDLEQFVTGVLPEQSAIGEPAFNGRLLPAYGSDGNPEGTGFGRTPEEEQRALANGYEKMVDPDTGDHVGWKKVPLAIAPPNPTDNKVPVKDKKGNVIREVTIAEGNADRGLEAKPGADGQVEYFLQSRIWLGKR